MKPLLDALPRLPSCGLHAVSLFSGGGLLDLGAEWAGLPVIFATDIDVRAVKAYEYNFGSHYAIEGDITDPVIQSLIPDAEIILGGPPCQDFSNAGKGLGEKGSRGQLVFTYLHIVSKKRPYAFLFENVKGLAGTKHRHTLDALIAAFEEIGYRVSWKIVNAWHYGVAQKRERVILVGIRWDFGFAYTFPEPEMDYKPVLRDAIGDLPEPMVNHDPKDLSVGEQAYLDRDPRHLQKHRPIGYDEPSNTLPANLYKGVPYGLMYPDEVAATVENHEGAILTEQYVGHTGSVLSEPAKTITAGTHGVGGGMNCFTPDNHDGHLFNNVGNNPTWEHANRVAPWDAPAPTRTEKDRCDGIHPGPENHVGAVETNRQRHDVPNRMDEPSNTIVASATGGKNAVENHERMDISDKALEGYARRGGQGGFGYRVNEYENPSPTIFGRIANEGKAFVHPETTPRPRRFTVRECLRIQSVPDSYVFPETLSLSAMYRVVGNGVPSRLAYHLVKALIEQLSEYKMFW